MSVTTNLTFFFFLLITILKNNDKGQKHVVTNCFEEYLMSIFKDIINRCNEIILQEGSNFDDGGHNIQHQRLEKCDHNTFYHCNRESSGLCK